MAAPVSPETIRQTDPQPRRWSKDEYYLMGDLGFFRDQRVELIAGEIILNDWVHEPYPRPWSKDEFYKMAELGFFRGQRAELLEGEIVVMSPQEPLHYSRVRQVGRLLDRVFGPAFDVRMQGPMDFGAIIEPEPDIAVVPHRADNYAAAHPTTAYLVVEVSDSTLAADRTRKASLYAHCAVPDYWIVNIPDQQLEIFRGPVPDAAQPHGFRYTTHHILTAPATVIPLALPQIALPVADLL